MAKTLYRVTCRGMQSGPGTAYVVANSPSEAYERMLSDLTRRDLGFDQDRELEKIEVIAVDFEYLRQTTRLYS